MASAVALHLRDVRRERVRRRLVERDKDTQQAAYLSGLSDKQLAVINCKKKRITVRTGRRGGKTHLISRWLFKRAQDRAGAICLFVALTRPSAKRLIWGELRKLNKLYSLGAKFNGQELTVTLPNGSQIWLAGATAGPEIEKLRGHAFELVCTDESGSFGEDFEYLLSEVLDAALEDYDGTLAMAGTPNAAAAGAFFDRDTNTADHWAHFHWTVLDNPMFPRWAGRKDWRKKAAIWWADKRKREGWADDDPVMSREWLALWVRDANRLVYRVEDDNLCAELPPDDYVYILGGDLGWNDQKTIVVLACSTTTNALFFVDCFARSQMLIDDYGDTMKKVAKEWPPVAYPVDAGALGKDIVELLRQRHGIPVVPAQKTQKPANIAFLNSALRANIAPDGAPPVRRLRFLPRAKAVFEQMKLLQWKDKFQLHTDQAFREDLCDAALYAFRYATNVYKPDRVAEKPKPGTREFAEAEAAQAKQNALRRVRMAQREGDPEHEFCTLVEGN